MVYAWLEDYLDEDSEVYFTIIDYIESVQADKLFKFIFHNDTIISLEFMNNITLTRNTEVDHLEFIRQVDLLELHDIPLVYKERVRLYSDDKTGVYKLNDDTHWTTRASITP